MSGSAVEMGWEVMIDFGNDGAFSGTDDVSQYVQAINIKTGIDGDLLTSHIANVGTCSLQLDNDHSRTGRRFSPALTTSPYFGLMLPDRAVRVRMYIGSTYYPLWRGYVRSFNPAGGTEGRTQNSVTLVSCADELIHLQDVTDMSIPLQASILSSTAIRHVINAALKAVLATALVTMTANPSNNNTLVVNGTTLTFKTALAGNDEVLIGATVGASAQNLASAINQGFGAATTYSSVITLPRIATAEAAISAGYDSGNVDANVYLRGNTGAGATTTITGVTDVDYGVGTALSAGSHAAQSFQVTGGLLSQITVTHGANTGSPTGTITWKIQSNSGGSPSGTVLQSGTYTPVASSSNTITPGLDSVALQASTTYWLTLSSTSVQASPDNYWTINGLSTNPYANGSAKVSTDDITWTQPFPLDDLFISVTTTAVTTKDKLAQSFKVSINQALGSVGLYLRKIGSPTGTMTLRIETDASGSPSGALVDTNATTTLAESSLTTSFAMTTITFATPPAILSSTSYWLVLSTDRSASATDFVSWGADASSPGYADGLMKSYASSTWSAETKDASFAMGATAVTLTSILRGTVGNAYTLDFTGSWATITGTPVTSLVDTPEIITGSGGATLLGRATGQDYEVAQSFQHTQTGEVVEVKITHSTNTGSPVGTMTLRIASDNSGDPGSILYSTTYTPVASAVNTITVTGGPTLTAAVSYWVWLEPTIAQAEGVIWTWQRGTSSSYANGVGKYSTDGVAWSALGVDYECTITTRAEAVTSWLMAGGVDYPTALPPSLETGKNTFQYVGDNWNEKTNAMTALTEILSSEYGSLLWIASDGTITFKNRNYLFTQANATAALTLNSEQSTLEGSLTADDVYNRVEVQYTPLATLTSGIIASAKSSITTPGLTGLTERWNPTQTIRDQPGTAVAKLPFIDPATSQPISALSVITPLIASTDWTANEASDGGGVSYTGSARLNFSVAIIGTNAEVTITNSALGPLFITTLKVRGVGLHRYNPQFAIVEEELAAGEQRRTLAITLPYSTPGTFADSLAAYLLSKWKDPAYRIYSLGFRNINQIGSVNLFGLDVGDAISVTDYQTGVSASKYLITGIEYSDIRPEPRPAGSITFNLYRLDDVSYWILESATLGVLGTTTRPAL